LRWDVQGDDPQVNLDHPVDDGDYEKDPRALGPLQPSQTKDYTPLILLHDLYGRDQDDDQENHQDADAREKKAQNISHLAHSYLIQLWRVHNRGALR
jgi:hypothetical protein